MTTRRVATCCGAGLPSGNAVAKLFNLRGGVHPEGRKELSADRPIRSLPLPRRLYVSLQQHIGAPAIPMVNVGDQVLKGQLIAAAQGAVSSSIHAPTSGVIVALGDHPAPHPSGLPVPTITLESDGEDRWIEMEAVADPFELSPEDIAARVGAAGIVGLGGATFPAALKLNLSRSSGVQTLIMNGGECEPYLTCDDHIMRERAVQIVEGIRLIAYAVAAKEVLVGIEDNKPEAIAAMQAAARGSAVQVVAMPSMYPMGSEKQIIQVLTGKEIPAGGRPADIGVLVHNVATAFAVQQAIRYGRPLISRIATVSGGAIRQPCNLEVLIGTPVQELIEYTGGYTQPAARLVLGGPMMGQQFTNTAVPVVKGTSGVLALTAKEIGQTEASPCIRCSTCVRACPVGLLPLEMAAHIRASDLSGAVDLGLKDCISCGSCSYVCPAHIPLVHFFNYAKGDLATQERAKLKQEATKKLADARNERMARIERERAEAAAKRKAAREAKERAAKEAAQKAQDQAATETA
ncbi:electron transport complex subunit RnfC [Ferrigenium kumadai]|uniref:Ion-translocating oxidoreductase complex subunit C n=1 Tax=Ferrigenium kumadai TaxID=1682490 RepID=A0AAN1SZ02_9PROT|nr:electron transport complex subunit RsxC [Ferrigenium kumadai]BBI99367.1 electron transport complex subunit RnfC [Ferrigenium kumadai]